jgi:hypothetical protein
MYVPPGMAPAAISAGVDGVQGPRHSALGLEGIEAQYGGANALGHLNHGGYGGGLGDGPGGHGRNGNGKSESGLSSLFSMIKAPTVRRKRNSWYA